MYRVILTVCAVGISTLANGQGALFQPGYVVRSSAPTDTVRGFIDTYRGTQRWAYVRFRPTPKAPIEVLRARDLRAAGTADGRQVLRSTLVSGDSLRLLEVVADGGLTLYNGYSPLTNVDFFVEVAGSTVLPLSRAQYVPVLQSVTSNCPTLEVKGGKQRLLYARKPLGQVVDAYNRCVPTARAAHFYPGVRPLQPELGIRVGMQRSQLWYEFNNFPFGFRKPGYKSYPTGAVQLTLPLGGGFRAVMEAAYSRASSYTQIYDRPRASAFYFTRTADLQVHLLQVPLMLRFLAGRDARRVRPFVEGGGGPNMVLSYRAWYTETPDVASEKPDAYDLGMNRVQYLIRGGGGVNVRTSLGLMSLAYHAQRLTMGSPREKTSYGLQQSDFSLTYFW